MNLSMKNMPLNILLVTESNSWVDTHIGVSLMAMNHVVHRFYYGTSICEFYGNKRRTERAGKNISLLEKVKQLQRAHPLDLIFFYAFDDLLIPRYMRSLSMLNVPMVIYTVDMACQWYRLIRTAKYFSYILCAQPENMDYLKKYNPNVILFPMAARPSSLMKHKETHFQPHAPTTFLGTPTPYRKRMLSALVKTSIPLAIYGKYWQTKQLAIRSRKLEKTIHDLWYYGLARLKNEGIAPLFETLKQRCFAKYSNQTEHLPEQIIHEFLPDQAMNSLFQHSKINLGFTKMIGDYPDQRGISQMRLRDFEVPYAGGFYLVEEAPGYEHFFKPGSEVVTWKTTNDLIDKIHYYLKHDTEREAIARAGQKRAITEHTWAHRFNMLFQTLGLLKQP
ncbi:MAG: hypothetical protein ACD_46C00045G0003 [uncultured bacterium]|nr:MAG: hypothetical protein ACD_46C00045G0003 [uncultured bacterium]